MPPWKIFDYDQANLLQANQGLQQAYGQGVCLALAMLWCRCKKRKIGVQAFVAAAGNAANEIAQWMNDVQDAPLQALLQGNLYYTDQNGTPISAVNNTMGQVNNYRAYAHRLECMSRWGRANGLVLLNDHVGFPNGPNGGAWAAAVTNAIISGVNGTALGIIGLTGAGGHALGFRYSRGAWVEVELFDPNEGSWGFRSVTEFRLWLANYLPQTYQNLAEHWWVVQYM